MMPRWYFQIGSFCVYSHYIPGAELPGCLADPIKASLARLRVR